RAGSVHPRRPAAMPGVSLLLPAGGARLLHPPGALRGARRAAAGRARGPHPRARAALCAPPRGLLPSRALPVVPFLQQVAQPMKTLEAEVEIEVDFYDVDAMEVTWHGHYVKYFERARCALLRKIGYDYPEMRDSGYAWPIVDCRLRYVGATRY